MMRLRKTDHSIQCVLGFILLLSLPALLFYGFLAGLFLLGCWQLLSAFFNTSSFYYNGMGYQICSYWKYTGLIFVILFLWILLAKPVNPDDVQVLAVVAVTAAIPVAVYYLNIYKKLIGHLVLRNELGGLLRSKH
jgi:hypothetical protein